MDEAGKKIRRVERESHRLHEARTPRVESSGAVRNREICLVTCVVKRHQHTAGERRDDRHHRTFDV